MDRETKNRGSLDPGRTGVAYKHQRIEGGADDSQGVHKRHEEHTYFRKYGQCNSGVPSKQKVQPGIDSAVKSDNGDMGVLHAEEQRYHGNLSPGQAKPDSRLSVTRMDGWERLEARRTTLLENDRGFDETGSGPVREQNKHTTPEICELEARPESYGDRQFPTEMDRDQGICVPAILSFGESVAESLERESYDLAGDTGMASSNVVFNDLTDYCTGPSFVAANEEVTEGFEGQTTSDDRTGVYEIGGLESLRRRVTQEGFSKESTDLLMDKWRDGTKVSYQSAWRKWSSWARGRTIDPFQATVAHIVNFLSSMHREGKVYSTINGYRSAISAIHPHIEKRPVGEHKDIRAVIAGIFNRNPPKPRYSNFWDVEAVLTYIRAMGENVGLVLKDLGMKLAILLALTTAGRSSDLGLLATSFMADQGDRMVFFVRELGKTRKIGQPPPKVEVRGFKEDSRLDPLACLNEYLARTKKLRPVEGGGYS